MKKQLSVFVRRAILATGICLAGLTTRSAQAQSNKVYDWSWANQLGPSSYYAYNGPSRLLYGLAADATGNVTVGGLFDPDLTFANETPVLRTNRQPEPQTGFTFANGFIAQYRPNGSLAWSMNLDGIGAQVNNLATDAAGNIYAIGSYGRGQVTFGDNGPTLRGTQSNTFLAKLSPAGTVQWAVNLAVTSRGASDWKLAVDAVGNSVVQGFYSTTITIGTQTYTGPGGSNSPFLARFAPTGILTGSWAGQQTQGSDDYRTYTGLTLAPTGEVYVAGFLSGSVTLQFGSLPPISSTASTANANGFLLKVSAANTPEWVLMGRSTNCLFEDVKVSPSGAIYLMGGSYGNGNLTLDTQAVTLPGTDNQFIVRLRPNGTVLRTMTGYAASIATSLVIGPRDDLYFATYQGKVSWGQVQLTPAAGTTGQLVGVVRLDSTGQGLQGWQATGATKLFQDPKLAVDALGRAALGGWLYGTGTTNFGSQSATSFVPNGMFVARTGTQVLASHAAAPVAGLQLYPNPARQTATVGLALAAPAQAQLLDALGRVVSTQALPPSGRLDLSTLAPGAYLVRVQQGEAVSYRHLAVLP